MWNLYTSLTHHSLNHPRWKENHYCYPNSRQQRAKHCTRISMELFFRANIFIYFVIAKEWLQGFLGWLLNRLPGPDCCQVQTASGARLARRAPVLSSPQLACVCPQLCPHGNDPASEVGPFLGTLPMSSRMESATGVHVGSTPAVL